MSYDDLYTHSETRKTIEKRKEVNFIALDSNNKKKEKCPVCQQTLKPLRPGVLICPACGNETELRRLKQEKKLISKFGSSVASGPIIMSQNKRNQKPKQWYDSINENLTEEDKNELRAAGFMI